MELSQAAVDKQVEATEAAQQAAAAPAGAPAAPTPAAAAAPADDSKKPAQGVGMLAESSTAHGSKLQTQINKLKSGYSVEDLKKAKSKPAAPAKKKAAPAKKPAPAKKGKAPAAKPKPKPAPKAVTPESAPDNSLPPERPSIDLQASLAASKSKEEE